MKAENTAHRGPFQFDLQSLFWLTVTVSLALAFLRQLGRSVVVEGVAVIGAAAGIGLCTGLVRKRIGDVVYWSVLAAAFAFMSVVHVTFAHGTTRYAWVVVGIVTGSAIGCVSEERVWRPIVIGGLTASLTMGIYAAALHWTARGWITFDLLCAPLIGALFGGLIAVLRSLQRNSGLRHDATATFLMLSVVAGNSLTRYFLPGALAVSMLITLVGCGKAESAVDPAPFQAAVEQYLDQHGMALRLKTIRNGPTVTGNRATMSASMTHVELGGPSVVWEFEFEKTAGGDWTVRRHQD